MARKRIYGKLLKSLYWNDNESVLMNRCIEIYQLKSGLKGVLWKFGFKSDNREPISIEIFHYKQNEVKEQGIEVINKEYEERIINLFNIYLNFTEKQIANGKWS